MGISGKLKILREKAGLSQSELAEKAGVPLDSLQNWEQARNEPLPSSLRKIANALGCSLDDLLPGPIPGDKEE